MQASHHVRRSGSPRLAESRLTLRSGQSGAGLCRGELREQLPTTRLRRIAGGWVARRVRAGTDARRPLVHESVTIPKRMSEPLQAHCADVGGRSQARFSARTGSRSSRCTRSVEPPLAGERRNAPAQLLTIERVAVLKRVGLFADVPGHKLVAVARLLEEMAFDAGDRIIERGSVEDWLFVVAEGRIRVHIGDMTLLESGPGGVVGEFALLAPAPRSASATAIGAKSAAASPSRPVRRAARRPPGDIARGDVDARTVAAGRRRHPR